MQSPESCSYGSAASENCDSEYFTCRLVHLVAAVESWEAHRARGRMVYLARTLDSSSPAILLSITSIFTSSDLHRVIKPGLC